MLASCTKLGPSTIPRDRVDYGFSITESWKRQTLLNIVKLRYLDPPIFVDVGQIVAGYSLETTVNAGASFPKEDALGGQTLAFGAQGRFTDRPTITYFPLTGNAFMRSLLTPMRPETIFSLIQAGVPASSVLSGTVASINGLKNQEARAGRFSEPQPEFLRLLELLDRIQRSGSLGLRVKGPTGSGETCVVTFRSGEVLPETVQEIDEARRLLKLDPDVHEFRLVFAAVPVADDELAVITRSLLQIMQNVAAEIEAPPRDVAEGRVTPGPALDESRPRGAPPLRIHSDPAKPSDAFVAVPYRDHWFWIDDRDLRSKQVFGLLMLLFTLVDTGERQGPPVLTIPAQ
jgi:hypothetical protein